MKIVAFDESGNSGENLLDSGQPVYALAGVSVAEDRAGRLVSELLDGRQASELKFGALRKRRSGQRIVLDALTSPVLNADVRRLCVSQKSWFLAGKIIDLLLEPVSVTTALYESGMHRLMADWLHNAAASEVGEELWEGFLAAFVRAARVGTDEEVEAMRDLCECLGEVKKAAAGTTTGKILSAIPVSVDYLGGVLGGAGAKDQLEPALTSLVEQLQGWSERLQEPFRVVHDDSKVIEGWVDELLAFANPEIEPVSIETDVATFSLPLRSTSIEFAVSETNPMIQLADIVAGAAAWWLRDQVGDGDDVFGEEIREAGLRAEWATGSLDFQRAALLGG